ncbi:MAG TPA: class I SAM-dependent methyltransferase [Anaerolineae bacterium]|nr:class I SAM-dependent methyltransferase [Caldilineae bacterium]HID34877.1 class I SAM-dependent methyltransferase [Anaerolineae bacterium]
MAEPQDVFATPQSVEDPIGYETLRRMASVAHYNRWIYEELSPYAGRRLLEVGCGIGNMTEYFLDRELLVGVDRLAASVQFTRRRFQRHPHVEIFQGDITDAAILERLRPYRFDTVICINVLEHIQDDVRALQHMRQALQPGGRLLLLVPAGPYLYGELDGALGHHRRYERGGLAEAVQAAGFRPIQIRYMNLAGIAGWWLNSRVLRRRLLPKGQLAWFDRLAPLFIRAERLLRRVWDVPAGQSLICIAEKRP